MFDHYSIDHNDESLLFRKRYLESVIERIKENGIEPEDAIYGLGYSSVIYRLRELIKKEEQSIESYKNIRNIAVGILQQLIIIYSFMDTKYPTNERKNKRNVAYYELSKEYKLMPKFIAYMLYNGDIDNGYPLKQVRERIYNGMKIKSGNQFPDWWNKSIQQK